MTTALRIAIASMAALGLTAAALPQAADAAQGCGHHWHRNHHGFCVPNGGGGGGGWHHNRVDYGPAYMMGGAMLLNAFSNMSQASHQNQPTVIYQQAPQPQYQPQYQPVVYQPQYQPQYASPYGYGQPAVIAPQGF